MATYCRFMRSELAPQTHAEKVSPGKCVHKSLKLTLTAQKELYPTADKDHNVNRGQIIDQLFSHPCFALKWLVRVCRAIAKNDPEAKNSRFSLAFELRPLRLGYTLHNIVARVTKASI